MQQLEGRYDQLQEAVEKEMDQAWVNAGWLNPFSADADSGYTSTSSSNARQGLKRKHDTRGDDTANKKNKKQKKYEAPQIGSVVERTFQVELPCEPLGVPTYMVPLADVEMEELAAWTFQGGYERGGEDEICQSPRGTTVFNLCRF